MLCITNREAVAQDGETPLHLAARTENGERCAELLIKSGAEVNCNQNKGETPLHVAARFGHLKTAELLLEDESGPERQSENGETPLHVACISSHYAVASKLVDHWKVTHAPDNGSILVNIPNQEGEISLHYAAQVTPATTHYPNEDRDLIKLLLKSGGDVNKEAKATRETPVHYVCRIGNCNILEEILKNLELHEIIISFNKQDKNGWSPLLYASHSGNPAVVKLLLQQHARIDVFDEVGKAALHLAAERGHAEVVDILLANNAFVNSRSKKGLTPLHLAAQQGFSNIAKKLVSSGAVLDGTTLSKQTPLHLAAESGQLDMCSVLLTMKADANSSDNHGQTPLLLAAENNHPEVVKLFLRHKPELVSMANAVKRVHVRPHSCDERQRGGDQGTHEVQQVAGDDSQEQGEQAVSQYCARCEDVLGQTGNTALHLAAEGGHADVVRVLVEAGAPANDENTEGYTALHLAAKYGHVKVLESLKSSSSWRLLSRKTGLAAIHLAAIAGQADFIREMLTQIPATIVSEKPSAEISVEDYGLTSLHFASDHGHEGVVRLLLNSAGVQIDTSTLVLGSLPLHLSARGGHLAAAGLLLSRSTDQLHVTDKQGRTPLHLASAHGHRDMVGLLLGQGADINAQDNNGWTALHYTARHGFLEVVQLLVDSGASPVAMSKDEKIPLCLAAGAGHYVVIKYLLKKEHDTQILMEDKHFLMDLMVCGKTHSNKPVLEFALVSAAPIDTAVKMARSYQLLALREKDRARDLETVAEYCETLAVDLLSIAAVTSNPGTLLRAVDHYNTPFLDVLIELQTKEVVAHPAVQKYLTDLWMGNLQWAGWKIILLFMGFIVCPIIWIVFSLPVGHRFSHIPIIKFMSYLVSHIFFIIILSFTIINPWTPLCKSATILPNAHEWFVLIWLIGLVIADVTNPRDREGLGWIKVVIMVVGWLGIGVHFLAFLFTKDVDILTILYIRNQFLAVALLLCFVEFLNFLTFHHLFGPWTVIIRDLIKDLMRFLAILIIFLAGFSLHVSAIYQPVRMNGPNCTILSENDKIFQSPLETFEMLFFALFGLVEPDQMPLIHQSPFFSKTIMKSVFGVYMMVTVVVLINLLIAMMSNTYQRIQAQSDTEWKFGRAKLIRNMNKTSPSPAPINILVMPAFLYQKIPKKRIGKL
ncbi:hypothetical protein LAZ67_13000071 [Cordylochernes scorpioides]|uniref:Ion transport domain-containing protein n=1 Tax=Cordylochernes scorpioides TaxID=51811 RepID=A0ABY6L334_9ARAC|nr:hypothetical protein LAZ67_13000071 [Cordylochernes scorpioides]